MHQVNRADVILSDWKMPTMDGPTLCRKIRSSHPPESYTHFILLTGQKDKAHFVEGMGAGADEYLTKPLDLETLKAHLDAARRVMAVHRQLAESNSTLRRDAALDFQVARTDPLAAAPNRSRLIGDLEALAGRARRYGCRYCAALCAIDGFNADSDSCGHPSGDHVFRRVCHAIRARLRSGDTLYRYGRDEFLLILPEQSLAQAATAMDRIQRDVEKLRIKPVRAAEASFVTISLGIAELSGGWIDGWLRRAQAALNIAQSHGRNRLEVEASA
jgi:two-component system chemotaxis response regulator CheY